jgi:Arc/MetJ-type ribon-helix-helix transcriptional regulator
MSIDINPETERVVRDELGQGHFRSVDELILFGVRVWREHNLPQAQSRTNGPHKAEEFVEWAQSHPPSPPLSDEAVSRASLNPDRW